jgi:hypothetical protein
VVVSNVAGTVTSEIVWLSVVPTNVVHLADRELAFGTMSAPIWIASKKDDYGPIITGDGLTLIYELGGFDEAADLYVVTRPSIDSTNWSSPVNLGTNFNSPFHDGGATISPDGLSLYFDSTRPGGIGDHDIYVCTRPDKQSAFGPPVNLGPAVNSSKGEGGARVSADNLTLVFASDRSNPGQSDTWMCTRSNAYLPWQPSVRLPAPINVVGAVNFPIALSGDGLTMIFKSDRPNSFNRMAAGCYVTRRHTAGEPFGAPALIRPILATGTGGVDLGALSADGKTLWIDTFEKIFPDWTRVVQFSIEELPRLETIGPNTEGTFQLALGGREGATYEVQSSSDLTVWTSLLTTNTFGRTELPGVTSTVNDRQYYRVLSY